MEKKETQFALRLSTELKSKLSSLADQAGRSLNSEIVFRLESSLTKYLMIDFDTPIHSGHHENELNLLADTLRSLETVSSVGFAPMTNRLVKTPIVQAELKGGKSLSLEVVKVIIRGCGVPVKFTLSETNQPSFDPESLNVELNGIPF